MRVTGYLGAQSGHVNILVDGVVKARRSRGDFIGEIALIFACDRMADAVAVDDVEVYSLSRRDVLMAWIWLKAVHTTDPTSSAGCCPSSSALAFSRFALISKSHVPSSRLTMRSSDAPRKTLRDGRSPVAAATLGGL